MIACFAPATPPPNTPTTVGSPSPLPPGKLQESRARLAESSLFPRLAARAQARQAQARGDAPQTRGDGENVLATPTRPPRQLDGPPADAIPLIPSDRVPPPAPAAEPRAKKRGGKGDAGPEAKRSKKPATKKKKRKAPTAAPRPPQIVRPKRDRPAPPAVVAPGPSCMALFGKEGDRGEDACGLCKRSRHFKAGVPLKEAFSKVRKEGYTDRAGTEYRGCRHPDGPNGGGY